MITDRPIRTEEEIARFEAGGAGAVVTFKGVIRPKNDGRRVTGIFYDCYREMAEREIADVLLEAKRFYPEVAARAIHRIGEVAVGEVSLLVLTAAEHRRDAYAANQQIVDELKRRLPIWKKERYADADSRWL